MAAIAAGDTTATVVQRFVVPIATAGNPLLLVTMNCVTDPGTTDTYATGGIALDNLFTTGNASDTWLDTSQPIVALGAITPRISDAETPACLARFANGGLTAADQKLVLYLSPADDGAKNDTLVEYPAEDITANTTVVAALATGDKDIRWTMTLMGRLRPGVTTTGLVL